MFNNDRSRNGSYWKKIERDIRYANRLSACLSAIVEVTQSSLSVRLGISSRDVNELSPRFLYSPPPPLFLSLSLSAIHSACCLPCLRFPSGFPPRKHRCFRIDPAADNLLAHFLGRATRWTDKDRLRSTDSRDYRERLTFKAFRTSSRFVIWLLNYYYSSRK